VWCPVATFFVCWRIIAKLLYLIFSAWSYQAAVLTAFNTWPIGLLYTAVGMLPDQRGGIKCSKYCVLRRSPGMDIEGLCWRCETGGMPTETPSLASPMSGLALSHNPWFLWVWLDAHPQKFSTRYWVGARKSASNRAPHLLRPALALLLVKSARTVSGEFYLEKRVYIGLTSYGQLRVLRQYFAAKNLSSCCLPSV